MSQKRLSPKQKNPFDAASYRFAYLVYRSKRLAEESRIKNPEATQDELHHWRTFGYYDGLIIDDKTEGFTEGINGEEKRSHITYKDCFAIRYPSAFAGQQLLDKQVFTLLPFPEDGNRRSQVLYLPDEEKKPFLGMIMIGINLVQDESGELIPKQGKEPDYLKKLRYYRDRIAHLLKLHRHRAKQNDASLPSKNLLSGDCRCECFLSTNCADLCVVMRTGRLEDIYLLTKLIRIHLSLTEDGNDDGKSILRCAPQLNTITAMSTRPEEYDIDGQFNALNNGMAVDFRLSCNSKFAEEKLLSCCANLMKDKQRDASIPANGIIPGERIGGVLGVGQYSIYMPLLAYLSVFFHEDCFLKGLDILNPTKESTLTLRKLFFDASAENGLFEMEDYTISNVRLRFCNNANLVKFDEENEIDADWWAHSGDKPFHPVSSQAWRSIEEFLIQMRHELSLYRNQVHYSSYMVKESFSMINDLYYTYNDLLYLGNIHSFVLATQLFALTGNVLQYLKQIAMAVERDKPRLMARRKTGTDMPIIDASSRSSIIKAIDKLVEMINQVVLSINSYNKSLVAFSQQNLNFPSYEIQSKVNIEKYQVAYSAFVQSLCDAFPKEDKPILAYVYLDLSEKDTLARLCFAQPPFDYIVRTPESKERKESVSVLAIASPNYRRFAHMHHLLPQLCHEIGHHFRTFDDRAERNRVVFSYMLEPVARQAAEHFISAASSARMSSYSNKLVTAVAEEIREVLLKELYAIHAKNSEDQESGSDLDEVRFAALEPPLNAYLSENLNYEISSFQRFWNGFKELLAQADTVSVGRICVCGRELVSMQQDWIYVVNLPISALNYHLFMDYQFSTGFGSQARELHQHQELLRQPEEQLLSGWQLAVKQLSGKGAKDALDARALLMICMQLACGICTAYRTYHQIDVHDVSTSKGYMEQSELFIHALSDVTNALSYYCAHPIEQLPSGTDQMDQVWKALRHTDQMYEASVDMARLAQDRDKQMMGHAERCYQVCQGVRNLLFTLRMLLRERSNELPGDDAPTTVDQIPFVIDPRGERSGEIEKRLQEVLLRRGFSEESLMRNSTVSRLQNRVNCDKWLDAAFRQLQTERCLRDARSNYEIYNEICADLAMCAAMKFTPFGYLAYTEHSFAEQPEETGDLPFTVRRVASVVTTLLQSESETSEKTRNAEGMSGWRSLIEQTGIYQENIHKFSCKVKQDASAFLSGSEIEEMRKWADDSKQTDGFRRYIEYADEGIWRVDEVARLIREKKNGVCEECHPDTEQEKRRLALLDRMTDLLSHLRTLQRISTMMPFLRDTLQHLEGQGFIQQHYCEVLKRLREQGESARNQWIQRCWKDETLGSIARHYNQYYERPGQEQTDEYKDQIHFILRFYWEGNLRLRCLRREKYCWNGETMEIIGDWFRDWQKGSVRG